MFHSVLDRNNHSYISCHEEGMNRHWVPPQRLQGRRPENGSAKSRPAESMLQSKRLSSVDPYRQDLDLSQLGDTYLLHLCQKNDWKTVERICDVISNTVNESSDHVTEATLLRVQRARKQLQTVDPWGNTALHLVCYHKPPAYVVSALLTACKRTRSWYQGHHDHDDFVLHPNHHGATPLLIACRSGASQQVLQLLLPSDSRALLPRDYQAVHVADVEGNTGFTGLVQRYSMLCKVPHYKRYCTSLYARAILATNTNDDDHDNEEEQEGATNLEITIDGIQFDLSCSSNSTTPWDDNGPAHVAKGNSIPTSMTPEVFLSPTALLRGHKRNKNAARIFPELWENISLLMDAAWNDSLDEAGNGLRQWLEEPGRRSNHEESDGLIASSWLDYPMHATALVAHALPTSIIDLLWRLHHQDVFKHKEGYQAIHPVHFAVIRQEKAMVHHGSQEEERRSFDTTIVATMRRQSHLLERLMAMDPATARLGMPNSNRLVFHQAIASGLTWHIVSANGGEPGPVQILFFAAPELLTQRDGETGLYPFQLAAAVAAAPICVEESSLSSSSSCHYDPHQLLQVDTIYQLLRKAPEVLTHVEKTKKPRKSVGLV